MMVSLGLPLTNSASGPAGVETRNGYEPGTSAAPSCRRTRRRNGALTRDAASGRVQVYVDGVLRASEAPNVAGEAINVATGGRISLNELLRVMQKIVGTSLQPVYAEGRQGDVKDSQADITKARTRLGYEPTVDLEEGLRRTLDWFRRDRAAGR